LPLLIGTIPEDQRISFISQDLNEVKKNSECALYGAHPPQKV